MEFQGGFRVTAYSESEPPPVGELGERLGERLGEKLSKNQLLIVQDA